MATILIVSGSPSPEAPTAILLGHVSDVLKSLGHEVHQLSVRDLPTVALLSADLLDPAIRNAMDLVDRADGVVVASPVYRAAYSGLVQSLLNLLRTTALAGKVVLPLANGGTQGHLVAIDYALRPLLTARGATDVVPGHFVLDADVSTPSPELDAAIRRFAGALAENPGLATAS
ncbi:NADPH-dependent FMN reductase [Kibdelosporangium philippinense]|uniref:NADPH-dependent FMN reductase n=1 Tax=Kibdelosporangium philippinense TaxID=211113 RepID=A0ABS8ZKM7_9PSEU|nr:NADPH-dependent FMN reductase [Kibdelosporangium philippinense]MCE7008339.1 NADPH-dependent FMN reductase [Kibdelosporangium philippinense]